MYQTVSELLMWTESIKLPAIAKISIPRKQNTNIWNRNENVIYQLNEKWKISWLKSWLRLKVTGLLGRDNPWNWVTMSRLVTKT